MTSPQRTVRRPEIIACATDSLDEMQLWREVMEPSDLSFDLQLLQVLHAAVAYYCVAMPIGAQLLTDPVMGDMFHDFARRCGMGPQAPVEETMEWVAAAQARGDVHPDHDTRSAAMMVCGTAQVLASHRVVLPEDFCPDALGSVERMMTLVLPALTSAPDPTYP